eukprot:4752398-Amphidinium_carterae.1
MSPRLPKDIVTQIMKVVKAGITQPPGSVGHTLAVEICHSIRIQNSYFRDRVMWYMDVSFRVDTGAKKYTNQIKGQASKHQSSQA